MKTKNKNVIIFVLIQSLTESSQTLQKKDANILQFLKDILISLNHQIEIELKEVKGTPQTAKEDIKMLDNIVNALQSVFNILFDMLTENENETIQPKYQKFLNNLNDYRDNLEILTDTEIWEEVEKIHDGTHDKKDYVKYDAETFRK